MERETMSADCTPDTSDSLIPAIKRNHSADSPENGKKRKRVHFSDVSHSLSHADSKSISTSPLCMENVPKSISEWTEKVLPCLKIKVDENESAMYNVFMGGCLHLAPENKKVCIMSSFANRDRENNVMIDSFQHVFQKVFTLDSDSISSIRMNDLVVLEEDLKNPIWIKSFADQYVYSEKIICKRILEDISRKLQKVVWQLMYMVRRCQKKDEEVSEGMFQQLFVLFAEVFNLHIVTGSNVEKYTLDIGDDNQCVSVPDGVVCHPTTDEDSVCAVIQVKKLYPDEKDTTPRTSQSRDRTCSLHQIGPELQGQHVGQTLGVLPHSLFGNKGIFGILVQGTKVTISTFKADDCYYQYLSNGCLSSKTGATVTFSEQYNFLKKKGRMDCIQTFLDMKKLLELVCEKAFP